MHYLIKLKSSLKDVVSDLCFSNIIHRKTRWKTESISYCYASGVRDEGANSAHLRVERQPPQRALKATENFLRFSRRSMSLTQQVARSRSFRKGSARQSSTLRAWLNVLEITFLTTRLEEGSSGNRLLPNKDLLSLKGYVTTRYMTTVRRGSFVVQVIP